MRSRSFIILILLCPMLCTCRPGTADLTESEIYTIVNQIIGDNDWPVTKVCSKFTDIQLTDESAREFTIADRYFMTRQRFLFRAMRIKQGSLQFKLADSSHRVKSAFVDTACNQGILYHISFPLISADRKKVLIEFYENCNCILGSRAGKYLYEKKNGHWVYTKGFDQWISKALLPQPLPIVNVITNNPNKHKHA